MSDLAHQNTEFDDRPIDKLRAMLWSIEPGHGGFCQGERHKADPDKPEAIEQALEPGKLGIFPERANAPIH